MNETQDPQIILNRKREIRNRIRSQRKSMDPALIREASRRIQSAFLARPEFQRANAVGCYQALPYEVQTQDILKACRKEGKKMAVPAWNEERERYEMVWLHPEDPMVRGRWTIPEPEVRRPVGLMDLDCIVVPALAYDRQGGRLGHGGGHYDRMLGAWNGIRVGVAFDFQIHDQVPLGSQDIPVDLVITESECWGDENHSELKQNKKTASSANGAGEKG